MRRIQTVCASLCAAVTISGFQNCSQSEFTMIDPAAKTDKVAGQSVFGGGEGEIGAVGGPGRGNVSATGQSNANYGGAGGILPALGNAIANGVVNAAANSGTGGSGNVGASGNTTTGNVSANNSGTKNGTSGSGTASANGGTTSGTSATATTNSGIKTEAPASGDKRVAAKEIPVSFYCSNTASKNNGNIAGSGTIRVQVRSGTLVLCEFDDPTLRDHIMKRKSFPLSLLEANCSDVPVRNPSYNLALKDAEDKRPGVNMVHGGHAANGWIYRVNGGWVPDEKELSVVTDMNPDQGGVQISNIKCDETGSPLVIHMHSDVEKAEPLVLTSPQDGVWFDLLGRNSDPRPYTPKRISWHRSDQYYYIALPNARGEVRGIDQLFGDNTLGPDGRFAADGFAALAKYDGMSADGRRRLQAADGYITDADAVYSKLRLWQDLNFDGVAQASELKSLKEAGIAVIDLNFDPNYREVDQYGNETRYKSVVQDTSGRLHLLFDIWFKYELNETPSRRGLAGER